MKSEIKPAKIHKILLLFLSSVSGFPVHITTTVWRHVSVACHLHNTCRRPTTIATLSLTLSLSHSLTLSLSHSFSFASPLSCALPLRRCCCSCFPPLPELRRPTADTGLLLLPPTSRSVARRISAEAPACLVRPCSK